MIAAAERKREMELINKIRSQFYPFCADITARQQRYKEMRFYATPAPDVDDIDSRFCSPGRQTISEELITPLLQGEIQPRRFLQLSTWPLGAGDCNRNICAPQNFHLSFKRSIFSMIRISFSVSRARTRSSYLLYIVAFQSRIETL